LWSFRFFLISLLDLGLESLDFHMGVFELFFGSDYVDLGDRAEIRDEFHVGLVSRGLQYVFGTYLS